MIKSWKRLFILFCCTFLLTNWTAGCSSGGSKAQEGSHYNASDQATVTYMEAYEMNEKMKKAGVSKVDRYDRIAQHMKKKKNVTKIEIDRGYQCIEFVINGVSFMIDE